MIYYYIVHKYVDELYWDGQSGEWISDRDECTLYEDEEEAFEQALKLDAIVEETWKVKR